MADASTGKSGRGLHFIAFAGVIGLAAFLFNVVGKPPKAMPRPVTRPAPAPSPTTTIAPTPSVPPAAPRRLQFGVPVTRAWMRGGWSVDELGGSETYVWSDGPVSQLALMLPPDEDVRMDFSCQPYVYPGHPPQTVTVVLNGTTIQKVDLKTGLHLYTVVLPKRVIHPTPNTLDFVYGYAERPQVVEKPSADTRQLGVAWHAIDLNPVTK